MKKRLKFFNLFDIIVIGVIVILAAVLFFFREPGTEGPVVSAPSSTVNYTIELTAMQNDSAELIQVGDKLVDKIKKYSIGRVTAVEVIDYIILNTDSENGRMVENPSSTLKTAVISVTADCTETSTSIVVDGGYTISVGAPVNIRGPGYSGTGAIIAIERGGE